MATLIPGWTELRALSTPLTAGEAHLLAFLERDLGADWEIFAQPYLNGTRPDVVALHPSRGALIIEVKDWSLDCYSWAAGEQKWQVRGSQGEGHVQNPFAKVEHYRSNILRFLVPEVGALIRERGWSALGIVRVGVYFHGASAAQLRHLTAGRVHRAVWQLVQGSLLPGASEGWVGGERRVPDEFAPLLRAWLNPPSHAREQTASLQLSRAQERLAVPEAGFVRFRGVAGSGKTLVLAARAARVALAGGRVLVVSFNITLWHLLRDGVRRAGGKEALQNVVFGHFHGLASDLGVEAGLSWEDCGHDPALLVQRASQRLGVSYDAVLVDEAQDMEDGWGETLMSLVAPGGQFVAACDELQNVYGRGGTWLQDSRFGRWRELRRSVRLHEEAVLRANAFARAFLPGVGLLAESDQPMLPLGAPEFSWQDVTGREEALTLLVERARALRQSGVQATDIALLVPDHQLGLQLVERLEEAGLQVNHVFTDNQDDKRQKYAFWMGDARLKACTVHSFKGWEARHVVAVLDGTGSLSDQQAMLAYTAITRAQGSLSIVNLSEHFTGFGRTLPPGVSSGEGEHRPVQV